MKRGLQAQREAYDGFKEDVRGYIDIIVERLREKKAEWQKKKAEEEKRKADEEEKKKQRLGPGGLDPVEVLQSLPEVSALIYCHRKV